MDWIQHALNRALMQAFLYGVVVGALLVSAPILFYWITTHLVWV